MQLYLANITTETKTAQRLSPHFNEQFNNFLLPSVNGQVEIKLNELYVLESYHYVRSAKWMLPLFKLFKGFLLDSGAFTFMSSVKDKSINWEQYINDYGNYVKENNIEYYLELDIDVIVGLKEVERLRKKLETIVGRKCIPVWHKSRGIENYKQLVKEYDYIAIGGIVTQEIKRSQYDVFYTLLKIAKENNCKVHGLGFTNLKGLEKYKFYSVDSTAWLSGNKFGGVYHFNGVEMIKQNKKIGQKIKPNEVAVQNFVEWVRYLKYAEVNL